VSKYNLCSINSTNVLRILVQVVHFFYGYVCARKNNGGKLESEVTFVIPTGACGNLAASYIAQLMGLPIKVIPAVTENDIVCTWLKTGNMELSKSVVSSLSPAMDILVPYNWERIMYFLSNKDTAAICKIMQDFELNNKAKMPSEWVLIFMRVLVHG